MLSLRATTLLLNFGLAVAGKSALMEQVYGELKAYIIELESRSGGSHD